MARMSSGAGWRGRLPRGRVAELATLVGLVGLVGLAAAALVGCREGRGRTDDGGGGGTTDAVPGTDANGGSDAALGTDGAPGSDANAPGTDGAAGGTDATTPPGSCGPGLSCDPVNEVCVARSAGPGYTYGCEAVPTTCTSDHSCACLGTALCGSPPTYACTDGAAGTNRITCDCLPCV